jgi:hypothetical protein
MKASVRLRVVSAAARVIYVQHTLPEYEIHIDHPTHLTHVSDLAGNDPFVENLAEAHDELTSAFDGYIASKNWNIVYTQGGAVVVAAAQLAQQIKIDRGLQELMKDCNFVLAATLCECFGTEPMTAYQHLRNLDFVCHDSILQSNFDRIPLPDTRYPHLQLFGCLTSEFFKVDRLRGSQNDNNFTIFNAPNLPAGLEAHKDLVDSWFESIAGLHFSTVEPTFDYLRATDRVVYACKPLDVSRRGAPYLLHDRSRRHGL